MALCNLLSISLYIFHVTFFQYWQLSSPSSEIGYQLTLIPSKCYFIYQFSNEKFLFVEFLYNPHKSSIAAIYYLIDIAKQTLMDDSFLYGFRTGDPLPSLHGVYLWLAIHELPSVAYRCRLVDISTTYAPTIRPNSTPPFSYCFDGFIHRTHDVVSVGNALRSYLSRWGPGRVTYDDVGHDRKSRLKKRAKLKVVLLEEGYRKGTCGWRNIRIYEKGERWIM